MMRLWLRMTLGPFTTGRTPNSCFRPKVGLQALDQGRHADLENSHDGLYYYIIFLYVWHKALPLVIEGRQ